MRAVTSAIEAASISSTGWKSSRNCGTEKSNSAWTVERPTRNAPASSARRRIGALLFGSRPDLVAARAPSAIRIAAASVASEAPPISIRCVGPQSVTSWPNSRCQTSSSGKPDSAKPAQAVISTAPSGAYQSPMMRTEVALGFLPASGSAMPSRPATKTPNRPKRIR